MNHLKQRSRRTFNLRYKEAIVDAYDRLLPVSLTAAEAILQAEGIPVSYVNRWRLEVGR